MAFKFRFQQLLQICIHEENEVKNKLAQKDGQIAEVELEIKKIEEEYEQAILQKSQDIKEGKLTKVALYTPYLARLQKSKEFQQEELERLEKQREKILQELIEKRKNRNTYEKMRERDEMAWKKEQIKKEQKRLDEFANRMKKGVFDDA